MRYVVSCLGPAMTTTAASAGNVDILNPTATTALAAKIYEWSAGPAANSADNTYTVKAARETIGPGAWTNSVTPSPLDPKASASTIIAHNTQTVAPTVGVDVGRWGFHMRGGYRWVSIPGGELATAVVFSQGIGLFTVFAQGTDVLHWSVFYDE